MFKFTTIMLLLLKFMGKEATNTNKQIEILEERGMVLDYDNSKIKSFLLDIGYYRLGFYWHHFEMDDSHNFLPNTKLSSVIKLYYLDVDLRNIFSKYLNRIEINFRTKVIYYVSNKYKSSPTWFSDGRIVNTRFINESLEKRLYTGDFVKNNKALKKHHEKYINDKYAPAWKTLEFFTFGVMLNLYKSIKDEEIKKRISESLGILNVKKFESLIATVVLVRNICAHGDVLYDLRVPRRMPVVPTIDFVKDDRSSLNACVKVIAYFLGNISENRKKDFLAEIGSVFDQYKDDETIKEIVVNKIGYDIIANK